MSHLIGDPRHAKLHTGLILATAFCAIHIITMQRAHAQIEEQVVAVNAEYPGGISPSLVFAKLELLDLTVDRIIQAREIDLPDFPNAIEIGLEPMHVYQMMLACNHRLQEFDDQLGVLATPTISARPSVYSPRDVLLLVDLMLTNVRMIGEKLSIEDLPADEIAEQNKLPTDVFHLGVRVFLKLNALCGYEEPSPNEVFAEMLRADEDVRSMLRHVDPACRYRINAPVTEIERKPGDVFEKCREIRRRLNDLRRQSGLIEVPVPAMTSREAILPYDVFLQTQIIIAELNLLKLRQNTVSTTPLPKPISDKRPTDVYNKAEMILFLLNQLNTIDR